MTRWLRSSILLCGAVLFFATAVQAQPEGQPCEAEPTDQLLTYGAHIHPCDIGIVGDSDLFRFNGVAGEHVVVRVVDQSGGSSTPSCVLELFRPAGTVVTSVGGNTTCEIRTSLDSTGLFTARVSEGGNNSLMTYGIQLDRLIPAFPTSSSINPGFILSGGTIDPRGDADLYVFNGVSGDTISLRLTDQEGGSSIPSCLLELFAPDATVTAIGNNTTCVIDATLTQTGVFTARVRELGDIRAMTYNLEYQCLIGTCPSFHPLTVTRVGSGSVASTPAGIDCGADCFERYFEGTIVTLVPTPDPGASFGGWTGDADCSDGVVTMIAARSCIATFSLSSLKPTSLNDAFGTALNTPLVVPAPGVLSNDTSNGGGPMTAALVAAPGSGTVVLAANGGFTYTPNTGFAGVDSFTYQASNVNGAGNVATVTVTVSALPPPIAVNDSYSIEANALLGVPAPGVLANDNSNGGGAMSASLVSTPASGALTLNANGSFAYVPAVNFVGSDSFTYRAVTTNGVSNVATVVIDVLNPMTPQAPTSLVVDSVVGQLVTVRFSAPVLGPAPTGFVLKGGLAPGQVLASLPTGHTAPIFTFAAPNGSFFIRMHTQTTAGESGPSNEVPLHVGVAVTPSPPQQLTGLVNGAALALAWKNTFAGGPPTSVVLDVTGSLNASLPLGLVETFAFPTVPPGTYTFRVRGVNAAGSSAASNAVTLSFPGACLGPPLMPSEFLAYKIGNTIFVRWDPPPTGPAATEYLLQVSGSFNGSLTTPGRGLSGVVGPGSYGLRVRAQNACGASAFTPEQIVALP